VRVVLKDGISLYRPAVQIRYPNPATPGIDDVIIGDGDVGVGSAGNEAEIQIGGEHKNRRKGGQGARSHRGRPMACSTTLLTI